MKEVLCYGQHVPPIQSDPLNSYSLNSSFSLNLSEKFENFSTIIIEAMLNQPFN